MLEIERSLDGQLGSTAWIVLAGIIFIIVGGLSWCLYKAITAANNDAGEQFPDDV